ncbi:MAG TPA: HAD family hydrolase [Micavibrio sp.]|nr:HAD family hydrolase [Micavibrio sp.]
MTIKDLSHIRGIIWDLDGTLYRYEAVFIEACNVAAARTAIDLGLKMELGEATAVAAHSYREHGSSFKFFADHGIRYEDFHVPYHKAVDTTILAKNQEMKLALELLPVPMIILTNASRDWAKRTLNHLEYDRIFGDGKLLALEDVEFQAKSVGRKGFEKALASLEVEAEETLMVEDLARNLIHAKDMGMTTALVHHGKLPDKGVEHIDTFFHDTLELVRVLQSHLV